MTGPATASSNPCRNTRRNPLLGSDIIDDQSKGVAFGLMNRMAEVCETGVGVGRRHGEWIWLWLTEKYVNLAVKTVSQPNLVLQQMAVCIAAMDLNSYYVGH